MSKELTTDDKVKFIRTQSIYYVENSRHTLENIYKYARIKELVNNPQNSECFGQGPDETCKNCYLNECGLCAEFKDYLGFTKDFKKSDDLIHIHILKTDGSTMEDGSLETNLEKLKYKQGTQSYDIAKIVLSSNGKLFGDVIEEIKKILVSDNANYAKTRYYPTKTRIEDTTDLSVGTVTQKFLWIGKKVNVQN